MNSFAFPTTMNWTDDDSSTWTQPAGVNASMSSFLNASSSDLYPTNQTNSSSGPGLLEDDLNEEEDLLSPPLSSGGGGGGSLKRFNAEYQKVHGYISIAVCVCGIVANALNAVVLSRKTMQSATNFLLTALAVTDMLTMTSYLPYSAYFYCITSPDVRYPHRRGWIIYLLFNTNFIITSHTVAMWLTVSLAIFRYIVVCRRVAGPGPCTLQRAKVTAAAVVVATVVFCSPNYVMYRPVLLSSGAYWFETNEFITSYHEVFNYWVFGVVLKVAPCVLLTVLSTLLIVAMRRADKRRSRLKSQGRREESERTGEHNRTTAMLVTVVLSFVLSELPQGVLALLSGIDSSIFHQVYVPLGDVWDIIVLINSAVNFVLYCIMSRQFRQTFYSVFCLRCCRTPGASDLGAQRTSKAHSRRLTLTT